MQFRPVGIERLGEELAPEGFESAQRAGMAGDGCGKRGRCDRCHDAVSLFSFAAFAPLDAVIRAENQLWPDLLKVSFNCCDSQHTLCRYRIHPW
jgi:hypothetical protein